MKLGMLVEETSTATGTGTLQLDGATSGHVRFYTFFGTNEFPYMIMADDGSAFEWGIGTVNASHVLTRTLKMGGSSTPPVNFASGGKKVRSALITPHAVAFRPSATTQAGPQASGAWSLAIGGEANVTGANSIAVGYQASGAKAIQIGQEGNASGDESIAIFADASNLRSHAMCRGSDASHFPGMRAWNTIGYSGYMQRVECELAAYTTNTTATVMQTCLDSPGLPQVTANGRMWAVDAIVGAHQDAGTLCYARHFRALLQRLSDTLSIVGSVTETAIGASGGFTGSAQLTVATQQLRIMATGMASTNLVWGATVNILQVR